MATTILFEAEGQSLALEFDATLQELHSSSASATEHPVERGVNISDHVRAAPSRVSIEGMITNTPLLDVSAMVLGDARDGNGRKKFRRVAWMVGGPRYFTLEGKTSKRTKDASLQGGGVSPININGFGRPSKSAKWVPSEYDKNIPNSISGTRLEFPNKVDRVKEAYTALNHIVTNGIVVTLVTDLREYSEMLIESVSAPRTAMDAMVFSIQLRQVKFVDTATTKVNVKNRVERKDDEKEVDGGIKGAPYVFEPATEGLRSVTNHMIFDNTRRDADLP